MKTRSAALIIGLFVAANGLGCAVLSGAPATSTPCAEALRHPDKLQALAEAESREQNWELAYRYLALIHILHPGTEQDRELFPAAATLFRRSWAPHRAELDSIWTTSEPLFVYAWLAGFFRTEASSRSHRWTCSSSERATACFATSSVTRRIDR
jgi:hypothetical protein